MIRHDTLHHPLMSLAPAERLRISWFRAHQLSGTEPGRQTWALEALSAMTDDPIAVDVFQFDGTFPLEGALEATRLITDGGLHPAREWHLTHDGHTWALSSLRPAG